MAEQIAVRREMPPWGGASLFFCIASGIVAIGGGLSLAFLKAAGENSMLEAIAHGIGWYFIGKGLFMMASPFQVRGAAAALFDSASTRIPIPASPRLLPAQAAPPAADGNNKPLADLIEEFRAMGYAVESHTPNEWEIHGPVGTSYASDDNLYSVLSELLKHAHSRSASRPHAA